MLSEVWCEEINAVTVVVISLWSFLFVEPVDKFLRIPLRRASSVLAGAYTGRAPRATKPPQCGVLGDGRDGDYVARAPGNPRAAEWADLEDVGAPVWALPRITCNCGGPCAWDDGAGRMPFVTELWERRICP